MNAGEDAELKLGISAFYFSIFFFKASDGGYRNDCLGVGWNSVYVSTGAHGSQSVQGCSVATTWN